MATDDYAHLDYSDSMSLNFPLGSEVIDPIKFINKKDDLALNFEPDNNLLMEFMDQSPCWDPSNCENENGSSEIDGADNGADSWEDSKERFEYKSEDDFLVMWGFDKNIGVEPPECIEENQIITPKKTEDITKIKGWRKKQFTVDKSPVNDIDTLKENYLCISESCGIDKLPICSTDGFSPKNEGKVLGQTALEPDIDCAFVCDKLDNFLDREAELKINYEIPHLYAEYGIKLTSEALVSRPNLLGSNGRNVLPNLKDESSSVIPVKPLISSVKNTMVPEVEEKKLAKRLLPLKTKYGINEDLVNEPQNKKQITEKENNFLKNYPKNKEGIYKKSPLGPYLPKLRRSNRIMQNTILFKSYSKIKSDNDLNVKNEQPNAKDNDTELNLPSAKNLYEPGDADSGKDFVNSPDHRLKVYRFGMILYPGAFTPLNQFIQYHLQKLRSYKTFIDKKWATFAASAVFVKENPGKRKRMILPVSCCFRDDNESLLRKSQNCCLKKAPTTFADAPLISTFQNVSNSNNKFEVETKKVTMGKSVNKVEDCVEDLAENGDRCTTFELKEKRNLKKLKRKKCLTLLKNSSEESSFENNRNKNSSSSFANKFNLPCDTANACNGLLNKKNVSKLENSDEVTRDTDASAILTDEAEVSMKSRFQNDLRQSSCRRISDSDVRSTPHHLHHNIGNMSNPAESEHIFNPNETTFDEIITQLLAKKLNELKSSQSVTNSIDNLKILKPNVLELIKLNFIKENFLSGYVNIWYINSEGARKSRAFLTFSMNPPVEGATNLKVLSRLSQCHLPKIISEIITKENHLDGNEYAILYCDGKLWELHGSVNFTLGKDKKIVVSGERIQVFYLPRKILPELKSLQGIKFTDDKQQVLKWWIMNVLQEYSEILIQFGNEIGRITRSKIMRSSKIKIPSFISFSGIQKIRRIGISTNPRLWPYFLIGPYYVGENHGLSLKLNSKTVPFEYYPPLDRIKPNFLVKRFISSVIKHSWRNSKRVTGMWFYDRTVLKQSSFIEVKTKIKKTGRFQPTFEHDYSLSEAQDGFYGANMDEIKQYENNDHFPAEEIYLVPDIPNLGYLKGELHSDRSITIEHPLKPVRKIKTRNIGEWLNKMMKKRIAFIPQDLYIKWKVVKDSAAVKDLKPLDRFSLGGTHVLCSKGLFYLLSMTKDVIRNLGLNESFVMNAITHNPIINEVIELKELGKVVLMKDECDLQVGEVLQLALNEIEKLENQETTLKQLRISTENQTESLCEKYINVLEGSNLDENIKKTIFFYIQRILKNIRKQSEKKERKRESFQYLIAIDKFLSKNLTCSNQDYESKTIIDSDALINDDNLHQNAEKQFLIQEEKPYFDREVVQKLELKVQQLREILSKSNSDNSTAYQKLALRLNNLSQHLCKMKSNCVPNNLFSTKIESKTNTTSSDQYRQSVLSQNSDNFVETNSTLGEGVADSNSLENNDCEINNFSTVANSVQKNTDIEVCGQEFESTTSCSQHLGTDNIVTEDFSNELNEINVINRNRISLLKRLESDVAESTTATKKGMNEEETRESLLNEEKTKCSDESNSLKENILIKHPRKNMKNLEFMTLGSPNIPRNFKVKIENSAILSNVNFTSSEVSLTSNLECNRINSCQLSEQIDSFCGEGEFKIDIPIDVNRMKLKPKLPFSGNSKFFYSQRNALNRVNILSKRNFCRNLKQSTKFRLIKPKPFSDSVSVGKINNEIE